MTVAVCDIGQQIWDMKYRYKSNGKVLDQEVSDTWRRVARAIAAQEKDPARWEREFFHLLEDYRFLPGGRILANAGTERSSTTMFNCYVMNRIPDALDGIFEVVKDAALTQKQGGGVGFDFSTIRPRGDHICGVDSQASGPLSFMNVLDATCKTIMSAGQRRGAQMAVMRCDHPDIAEFITAKRKKGALTMFNLSVAVTDKFIAAVKSDAEWELVFGGKVYKTVKARELWQMIMDSTYNYAEPGVLFVDRVNQMNNLAYCETITATNPCGEQPLPPYGACLLGSLNLTRFVAQPFSEAAAVDFEGLKTATRAAVRFLDNVINISNYPLAGQKSEAEAKRRMGLGVTGLADLFIFMRLRYGSPASLALAEQVMQAVTHTAYAASSELAREKGSFPLFDAEKYARGDFVKTLPAAVQKSIRQHGIRNSHLISIAPTGTISLYAGNVSSGLEPVFAYHYTRRIRQGQEDDVAETEVQDYAYQAYVERFGRPANDKELPDYFVNTDDITPAEHIGIQATLQKYVDSAISKTVNIPADFPFEDFQNVYMTAWEKGCKGCTTYRPNANIQAVLVKQDDKPAASEPKAAAPAPAPAAASTSVSKEEMIKRPYALLGTTYKIKTPLSPDALYVTINDVEEDGVRRPYELFINTKNLQHFSWIVAMTRLVSAVFRRERDPSFLVEELKSIYDPNGGYFANGRYIPSLAADIGRVIEEHLAKLGMIQAPKPKGEVHPPEEAASVNLTSNGNGASNGNGKLNGKNLLICPHCHEKALTYQENCWRCTACGYSKCE